MSWPSKLVLVRHAQSLGNTMLAKDRAALELSTHKYPLTERGRQQAAITGEWLKKKYGTFDVRYASYYDRAQETMRIMYPGEKIYEDPRLSEGQRGIYHILNHEQLAELFPKELKRKELEGLYHHRPLGGENWPDMELRIHSFLGTLSRDCGGKSVVIVVHGHWLILFQRLVEHFSIDEAERRYHGHVVENASVTTYVGSADGHSRLIKTEENVVPWQDLLPYEAPIVDKTGLRPAPK